MSNFDVQKQLEQATSKHTALQYIAHLRKYWIWLEESRLKEEEEKPEELIMNYSRSIQDRYAKSTVIVAQSALITYFTKIKFRPVNTQLLTRNLGLESRYKPFILTRAQVDKFFKEISRKWNHQEETMAHVAWEGALRAEELVTIRHEYWKSGKLEVPVLKTWDKKTGNYKTKTVPISPGTWEAVNDYIDRPESRFTFWNLEERRRWVSGEWSGMVSGLAIKLFGLTGRESHITHNIFRNTRLTHLAEDTKNFLTVLQISGHVSPQVALKYFEQAEVEIPEMEAMEKKGWF